MIRAIKLFVGIFSAWIIALICVAFAVYWIAELGAHLFGERYVFPFVVAVLSSLAIAAVGTVAVICSGEGGDQ